MGARRVPRGSRHAPPCCRFGVWDGLRRGAASGQQGCLASYRETRRGGDVGCCMCWEATHCLTRHAASQCDHPYVRPMYLCRTPYISAHISRISVCGRVHVWIPLSSRTGGVASLHRRTLVRPILARASRARARSAAKWCVPAALRCTFAAEFGLSAHPGAPRRRPRCARGTRADAQHPPGRAARGRRPAGARAQGKARSSPAGAFVAGKCSACQAPRVLRSQLGRVLTHLGLPPPGSNWPHRVRTTLQSLVRP